MNLAAIVSEEPVVHRLAAVLLASLWQGTLIALAAAAVRSLLPRSGARARYAVGCLALGLMLVLPTAGLWAGGRMAVSAREADASPSAPEPTLALLTVVPPAAAPALEWSALARAAAAAEPWLVLFWIVGVSLLSLRFLLGWAAIEQLRRRWTMEAPRAVAESLRRTAARLRVSRPVRVVTSAAVRVPTALGFFRPVVLMPLASLSGFSAEEIEAMLAHELAHIRRHDYLVNLLQSVAETLLFYHPAVWWIGAAIRAERENCCDDLAVATTGSARRYARALLHLEEVRCAPVQFALAASGGSLSRRILRLLPDGPEHLRASRAGASVIGVAALVMLVGAGRRLSVPVDSVGEPSELISLSALSRPPQPPPVPAARPAAPARPSASPSPARGPEPSEPPEPATDAAATPEADEAEPAEAPEALAAQDPTPSPDAPESVAPLSHDRLEEFREAGVTPDFVRAFADLGYRRVSSDLLLALRIHGVNASYVQDLNGLFGRRLPLDTCMALRIHGVDPSYVREMAELLGKISPDEAQVLRMHGITAEYVRRFRDAGYPGLSVDEAVALRNHGVEAAMSQELVALGFPKPSLDELRTARDHGVTAEFVRGMRESGFADWSLDGMIALRNHGVTPEYARSLRSLGYGSLTADEAIALRSHGVTPEFVKDFQGLGYKGLTVDELMALRNHGVDAEFTRSLQGLGYKGLSVDELMALRNHGVTAEFARKANAASRGRLSVDDLIERKTSGRE